jgi:hypothetical protein
LAQWINLLNLNMIWIKKIISGMLDMTEAHATSDDRIALDTIVARLNFERFCKMFSEEADEAKRQTLANLITEEKAKLDAFIPRE